MTTTLRQSCIMASTTTARPVTVSASSKKPTTLYHKKPTTMAFKFPKSWGIPTLLAGFAAAQLSFIPPPSMASVYTPMPSIDFVSDADAADVLADIEDNKIPQLEVGLGLLSNRDSPEVLAAAETELEAIEKEAANLAEEEVKGPSAQFKQETSGLIAEINVLKMVMQGMQ